MRLKSLTIKGFKSFGEETVIHFNEHVTGIVGPNGAGKSNIVDAFRWVLGEQSTNELRLEKMSDVIFNGSKSKKASKLAKVTLSFDNTKNILPTEYNNISISRLLYDSGDSEYRLNDVPCRLKDITSLFLDTGIGSNTYAIIALGMVDDILADKEHSRRKMFEQASGISKYKSRKKETLSKLKSTTEDLDRVEDLLFELEQNMKSLERQARNARKYLEVKKEYQENSIQLALLSSNKYLSRIQELEVQLKKQKINYEDIQKRLQKKEAILQAEKLASLEREKELSEFQKQLNQRMTELSQLENQKQIKLQKISFAKENAERLTQQINIGHSALKELDQEISRLEKNVVKESSIETQLKRESEKIKAEYDNLLKKKEALKTDFDQELSKRNEIEQKLFLFEKDLAVSTNRKTNLQSDIKRFHEEISLKSSLISNQKDQISNLQKEIKEVEASLSILHEHEGLRTKKMDFLRIAIQDLNKQLLNSNRKLDAFKHEYDLLKSLIDNLEGFPESSKFLHHHWDNQVPILADVIDAEEEIKASLEQFLEPYLNHFIVKSIKQAIQAISLLSDAQKGKANFFVLDQIKPIQDRENVRPDLIPAVNLVKTDPEFNALLKQLLSDVYFFDGAIDELKYTAEFDEITILSTRGDFIKSNYTLSGGSVGLFEGKKIGRKKHLQKLQTRLSKQKEAHVKLEEILSSKEIEFAQHDKKDYKRSIEQNELKLRSLQSDLMQLQVSIDNHLQVETASSSRLKSLQTELSSIEKEHVNLENNIEKLGKSLQSFQDKESKSGSDLDELTSKVNEITNHFNRSKIDLIHKENELQSIQRDLEYARRRHEETTVKINHDKQQFQTQSRDSEKLKLEVSGLDNQLIGLYEEKTVEEDQLSAFEEKFYSTRSVIFDIEDKIRLLNKMSSDSQRVASELKEKLTDNRFRINALMDRVQIEFNLSKDEILNTVVIDDLEYNELEFSVEKLRNRLNRFGDINPMAVEAFEAIKERHANITSQRDDILEAKESLIETIQEIEETATQKFLQSFSEVRDNFRHVFRSLFTKEDDCDLIIEDPSNPLESDIDIVAKPKGKRPKSLSQLSGGEKTLTATALLFALYLLKPAPFCILDEVDAPLDDANVQKFNTLVNEFARDSQFIVVTHNKATMAAVDVLYGVFMPEQGNSKVTAVDFRTHEYEPTMQAVN